MQPQPTTQTSPGPVQQQQKERKINQSQGLVLITYREPAQVGFLLASQDLQGSGFANTVGADQPQDLTRSGCWQSEGKAHEPMTAY